MYTLPLRIDNHSTHAFKKSTFLCPDEVQRQMTVNITHEARFIVNLQWRSKPGRELLLPYF